MPEFFVDDRGNEANFFEIHTDQTRAFVARLDREAGKDANDLAWDNLAGFSLERWANEEGYGDEIAEAKINTHLNSEMLNHLKLIEYAMHNYELPILDNSERILISITAKQARAIVKTITEIVTVK